MKIAISGAAGFLGKEACDYFGKETDIEINALVGQQTLANPSQTRVKPFHGDLREHQVRQNWLQDCDAVIHFAERGVPTLTPENPEALITRNLTTIACLVQTMREKGITKLIYASGAGAIYPSLENGQQDELSPLEIRTPFALSKVLVETYLRSLEENEGWDIGIMRIANPFGKHQIGKRKQGIIGVCLEKSISGRGIPVWVTPEVEKDFIRAEDVMRLFHLFLLNPVSGTYNVGSGTSTSLKELFRTIENITGRKLNLCENLRPIREPHRICLDCSKAEKNFGWKANTNLAQNIRTIWDWYLEQLPKKRAA